MKNKNEEIRQHHDITSEDSKVGFDFVIEIDGGKVGILSNFSSGFFADRVSGSEWKQMKKIPSKILRKDHGEDQRSDVEVDLVLGENHREKTEEDKENVLNQKQHEFGFESGIPNMNL